VTVIKLLNLLVYLALARDGPAVENSPARRPERKVVLEIVCTDLNMAEMVRFSR
jgi:hypothetical protein